MFVETNVADEESVAQAVAAAIDTGVPLRMGISCAGIGWASRTLGKDGMPHDLGIYKKVIGVNLIGTFNVMRLAASAIARPSRSSDGERGVIVNTASVAAFDGQIGQIAYSASKAGVVGMTLPAARDLAPVGIRVLTIAPGLFDTPMLGQLAARGQRAALAQGRRVPEAPRQTRRSTASSSRRSRDRLLQRRDLPARRRPPHAAEVDRVPGLHGRQKNEKITDATKEAERKDAKADARCTPDADRRRVGGRRPQGQRRPEGQGVLRGLPRHRQGRQGRGPHPLLLRLCGAPAALMRRGSPHKRRKYGQRPW